MWTKQIKRKERDWLFNLLLANTKSAKKRTRERERRKKKKLNFCCLFYMSVENIVNEVSQTKAMYNTSGSDIDMEEFEYHSGSRKVSKQDFLSISMINFITQIAKTHVEKKRRDRINKSLDELKDLLAIHCDVSSQYQIKFLFIFVFRRKHVIKNQKKLKYSKCVQNLLNKQMDI